MLALRHGLAIVLAIASVVAAPATATSFDSDVYLTSSTSTSSLVTQALRSTTGAVRYVRADTRVEALSLLPETFPRTRPKGLIEIPSDMSAAKYGPCWLYPHGVHTRKSGNWGTVGAKPETECQVPVSVIRHETTIRYSWYIWWLQAGKTHVETDTNSKWFQSLELEYKCRGKGMTTWTGSTLGTIVFHGHKYYARVYHGVRDLACEA